MSGPRISRKAIKCGNAIRHDEKYVFAQTDEQNVIHPTRERETSVTSNLFDSRRTNT